MSASLPAQLAALGIYPRKALGQHFLVDPAHRARIVAAAELTKQDAVLEVGPGPGVLTEPLAEQAGRVVGVELDERLVEWLRDRFAAATHVSILQGNILEVDAGQLMGPAYKVVANLPYYITGAVVHHLLEARPAPQRLVITVQREVAERMVARPPDMSLLSLGVQFYATARIVDRIPAGAFYPPPKVDSAVVRLDLRAQPAVTSVSPAEFFEVARAGFGQKRKQLRNALSAGLKRPAAEVEAALARAGVSPQRRAETLTLAEWGAVAQALTR